LYKIFSIKFFTFFKKKDLFLGINKYQYNHIYYKMATQVFKIARTYPVFQYQNWISQTEELIETIPQEDNVLFWGAKGNDLTDDTAAFNTALTNQCPVYVPEGTYLIAGTITIPVNHELIGLCKNGSILHFTGAAAQYDGILMNSGTTLANMRTLYTGGNVTTSSAVSILGSNITIRSMNIGSAITETETAFGISFDFASSNVSIYDDLVHGVINAVRFTAAATRTRMTNSFFNGGAASTVVNFTNAGANNVISSSFLRGNSGATTGIDTGAASITSVGNNYGVTTPITGAGLLSSTVLDNSATVGVNTTAFYNVDGVQVLSNRITGYTSTTGVSVPARTLATGDNTAAQLTNFCKQLLADLITHGLIFGTITP
jgi:hypothetical protein